MQCAKTSPVMLNTIRDYRRELEYLYTRRYAIDAVITSLEEYDRHRATTSTRLRERKTA
jgi:hypothetical protein